MLMLLPFFAKHNYSMVVGLVFQHFFDLSMLNCFDKVLVIFINLFFECEQDRLYLCQNVGQVSFTFLAALLTALLKVELL